MSGPLTIFNFPFFLLKGQEEQQRNRHLIIPVRTVVCLLLFMSTLGNGPKEKEATKTLKKELSQTKLSPFDLGIKKKNVPASSVTFQNVLMV